MSNASRYFKLCRLVKSYLFINLRFPCVSPQYIETNFKRTDELQAVKSNATTATRWPTILILLVFLIYGVRNLVFVTFQHLMFDRAHLEPSLTQIKSANSSPVFRFVCLETNCSRLSPRQPSEGLAAELAELSVFSLCHPTFYSHLSPVTRLDSFGALALGASCLLYFLISVWVPLQQFVSPANEETLIFIWAPRGAIEMLSRKCQELLFDVTASYRNFCQMRLDKQPRFDNGSLLSCSSQAPSIVRHTKRPSEPLDGRRGAQQMAADCLPMIRTAWWHPKITKLFCMILLYAMLMINIVGLLVMLQIKQKFAKKAAQLLETQQQMDRLRCRMWRRYELSDDNWQQRDYLNLSKISLKWELQPLLETLLLTSLVGIDIALLATCYYTISSELSFWLAELRAYLLAWVTCSRLGVRRSGALLSVAHLRREFSSQISFMGLIIPVKRQQGQVFSINSQAGDIVWVARLTKRLLSMERKSSKRHNNNNNNDDDDDDPLNLLTLEKVYIQLRLFLDRVEGMSPSITILSTIIYVLNFGLLLIGIFISGGRAHKLTLEAIELICIGWLLSNIFIALAANFHSNTKKLQILMWSVIAQLVSSGEDNLRAQHTRLLWTKQIAMLDLEGDGIALKAYKIRITYVNLIQVLIWTGTILVLALKPQ